jgi:hypothetical protein
VLKKNFWAETKRRERLKLMKEREEVNGVDLDLEGLLEFTK